MAKYRVYLETTAELFVTVEADDPEEATERAFELAPSEVCAQCSGWGQPWSLDLGELDVARERPDGSGRGAEIPPELVED